MNNGFCFIYNGTDTDIKKLQYRFPGKIELLKSGPLFIDANSVYQKCEIENRTTYLIGNIYNRDYLEEIVSIWEANVYLSNNAELLSLLIARLGENALSMVEGDFCYIVDGPQQKLTIVTDSRGLVPIHLIFGKTTWLTSSLKYITAVEGGAAFQFENEAEVCQLQLRADDYTPIKNGKRLKPGSINELSSDSEGFFTLNTHSLNYIATNKVLLLPCEKLMNLIESHLFSPLKKLSQCVETIGIPLSGGLDSSLVTAIACKHFKTINTYSIGTELSNEFEFSRQVADALGTNHRTKVLTEADILRGVIESIYYNEIYDGLSAEIQSGLFNAYRLAQGEVKCMLTGYGSDLLFGGILNPGKSYSNPNQILSEQVYRTRWTGEFSTSGASHYGIDIRHPFWTHHLITLCHALDPYYKIYDNEVKNILREYADTLQLLPKNIVWRKKIGIHEGSSVNQSFADILGIKTDNYQLKNRFTWRIYKAFLTERLCIEEVNPAVLREFIKEDDL
ncbi:asparagine synthase family protein [Salmonella enterica]